MWLSAAFVIEEGFPIAELHEIAAHMAEAAAGAGVGLVTGDTKVVGKGAADGLYITTAGVGVVPPGRHLGPEQVQPGDIVLLSGNMADHGMAVMLARGDLKLDADIRSDTAALGALVEALLEAAPSTRWMRDPTRGGVATSLNELAHDCGLGVGIVEDDVPVHEAVRGACELLGLDPLHIANEGQFLAVVGPEHAAAALRAVRATSGGEHARIIGEIQLHPAATVVAMTRYGASRVVDMLVGDPLPRIC
jgi:hydrogenase expression/formation protein HypE